MHMQIGHKLVCQIQGPQKEAEKMMCEIAARWKRFLLSPFVDMQNLARLQGQIREFKAQLASEIV